MEDQYTVRLDVFNGPLDLLLYLVTKEEVDIYDIPISKIVDQFMAHVAAMQAADIEVSGDFLVMASTLMLVKSRMLLPTEEVDLEEEIDPRDELIQQLLEYKKFKALSRALDEKAQERSARSGRPRGLDQPDSDAVPLEEISVFDLVAAFAKILDDTGHRWTTPIIHSDKPISAYIAAILGFFKHKTEARFVEIFRESRSRGEAIGFFIGLLELTRVSVLKLVQSEPFGEIHVVLVAPQDELDKYKSRDPGAVLLDEIGEGHADLWRESRAEPAQELAGDGTAAGEADGAAEELGGTA